MKKICAFLILLFLVFSIGVAQDNEYRFHLGDLIKAKGLALPTYVAGQYLTNDGTNLSWGAISFVGYLRADGTVPLTADWPMGVFNLTQAGWHGQTIAADHGGTGLASYTIGDILHATGATAVGKLADVAVGQVLASGGVNTAPAWSASPTLTGTLAASNLTANPTLSAEQIVNFAGWTPPAAGAWGTFSGGKWTHVTGNTTALVATGETALVQGTKYEIVITLTHAGTGTQSITFSMGGQSFAAETVTVGNTTLTYNIICTATTTQPTFTPTTSWTGSINSVSVKIVTQGQINAEGITLNSGQLLLKSGNSTYPAIQMGTPSDWIGFLSTGGASAGGNQGQVVGSNGNIFYFGYVSGASYIRVSRLQLNSSSTFLMEDSAGVIQMGVDAAAPIDQTLKGPDGLGANKPGGGIIFQGGAATGSGETVGVKIQTTYSLPAITSPSTSTLQTQYTRKWEVGKVWAIVDAAAAVPIITITCPAAGFVNGKIIYSIEAIDHDGAEMQGEAGEVTFSALQHAAGAAYHIVAPSEVSTQNLSTGALTTTWTMTSGSDVVLLNLAVDSDMDFTTAPATGHIWLRIQIILNSPQTITLN